MNLKTTWCCLAMVLVMPLLGAVTNDFGVCYLPECKAFELTFKNHLTLFSGHSEEHRETAAKTITTRDIKRLNRHFYRATVEGKTPGKKKEVVFFQYQRSNLAPKRYGTLILNAAAGEKVQQVMGASLVVSEGRQEVLYSNGNRFAPFLHFFSAGGVHYLGDERYLVRQVLPFMEHSPSRYFLTDRKTGAVVQQPLLMVFSVWNQTAFAIQSTADDGVTCFYHLPTGKQKVFPEGFFADYQWLDILMLHDDEIVMWTYAQKLLGLQIDCHLFDGQFQKKAVTYTYERYCNILLQQDPTHGTTVLSQAGKVLWHSPTQIKASEKIDLDLDDPLIRLTAARYEALIFEQPKQMVLVDCVAERIYTADQIEHVGMGFFKLTRDGTDSWITL
ncbi:MAG: hypothetical protein IKW38_05810 [Kiritimatiellae bacterium]|nr:hypothetical protein [Kiritimatiellia bacterium]